MSLSYLRNPATGELYNSSTFDIVSFLAGVDVDLLLKSGDYRKELCRYNPLMFMLVYLPHWMKAEETDNKLSVNEVNIILSHYALEFAAKKNVPKRNGLRKAFLAPRSSSKSTTVQAMILWALAFKHVRFAFLFAAKDSKAKEQFAEIRNEIATNKLIEADFKTLTEPARLIKKKVAEADSANLYISQSGAILEARGIGGSIVGSKRFGRRPDGLYIDDVSRGEGAAGLAEAQANLDILVGSILPINDAAPVWMIGTVHYSGCPEDELLRSTLGERFSWVEEQNFEVHWIKPILTNPDGSLRSIWRERWSLGWLLEHSKDFSYSKDFLCRPLPKHEGMGWVDSDFIIEAPQSLSKTIISVDPGISKNGDPTGISVIGFSQANKRAYLLDVIAAPLKGTDLKNKLLTLVNAYNASDVVWEKNQGGEALPEATLGLDFPLPVHLIHSKDDKLVRAELLLTRYKKDQIRHAKPLPMYIAECKQFPAFRQSPNMVDSVGMGIEWLAKSNQPIAQLKVKARSLR